VERINYFKHELKNLLKEQNPNFKGLPSAGKTMLESVNKDGVIVVEEYWTAAQCSAARNTLDILLESYKDQAWKSEDGADQRLFGAEKLDPTLAAFWEDEELQALATAYEDRPEGMGFLMANRIYATESNLGSGGGWHRDSAANHQFKAILYLTDVAEENGPFQYIKGSHRAKTLVTDEVKFHFSQHQNRFTEEEIAPKLVKQPAELFTAKAGTLILVDTRGIHRGMPIKKGVRYAMTNYYLPHINSNFQNLLVQP